MEIKSRKTYYADELFIVEYEQVEDVVNLHVNAFQFSPSVLKKMYTKFVEMEEFFKQQGIKRMMTITPNPKFCKLFGGETLGFVIYEGKEHEVIIWELK
jgi:hypothetical protein